MRITTFPTVNAATANTSDEPWEAFVARCKNPQVYSSKQACPLIKLATFGEQRTARGALRHDANVLSVSGIEGDYDAGDISPDVVKMLLECEGIKALIYTTPSHTAKKPRWRVLCPLSAEHQPNERREMVARLNGALGGILAPESFGLSQSFYFGSVEGVEYESFPVEGEFIDLLPNLLAVYPPNVVPVHEQREYEASTATPEIIDDLQSALKAIPADDRATWISVGQALRGLGGDGFKLWAEWSATSAKHNPDDDLPRWETFTGDRTGFPAVFARAQGAGWVNPRRGASNNLAQIFGAGGVPPVGAAPVPVIRYTLLSDDDLYKLPPQQWRIKKVLPETGLAAVFGASGSGKSFLVLDMLQQIGKGNDWFGCKVKPCNVLYCALEGEGGIAGRVAAFRIRHGTTSPNIRYLLEPFSLLKSDDIHNLALAIHANRQGAKVIILDTLNRAAPGADENDSKSMGQIIAAAKELQTRAGGLVLLVHHTGKDASKGLRGHSSLLAALDAAIEVRRDGDKREWVIAKSKDGEDGEAHPFKLDVVELGIDEDGEPITSCTVHPIEENAGSIKKVLPPKSGNQRAVWDALGKIFSKVGSVKPEGAPDALPQGRPCITLEAAVDQTRTHLVCDANRRTERAQSAIRGLIGKGLLCHEAGFIWCK